MTAGIARSGGWFTLVDRVNQYADLFARIGASPQASGAILSGPPGQAGKSMLARAVAGECGAHIEIVSGPSLLSKWMDETEAALRGIFERARQHTLAIVLFNEIDWAMSRSAADTHHQKSMVTQLLTLLDGLLAKNHAIPT